MACAFAVSTAGGEPGAAPAQLPPGAPIDHFKCYEIDSQTAFKPREVVLRDQFHEERPELQKPDWLCNPVKKNRERQLQKRVHLKCYPLKEDRTFQPRDVLIDDQFLQDRPVRVLRPERLCVPSFKDEFRFGISSNRLDDISQRRLRRIVPQNLLQRPIRRLKRLNTPPKPRGKPERRLDHYKCYAVERQPLQRTVQLLDQFETDANPVIELLHLCNPVDKNDEGIDNRQVHLTCYRIRDRRPRFQKLDVRVWNQFGVEDLTVIRPIRLCLPALKQEGPTRRPPGITPGPPGAPPQPPGPGPPPPFEGNCTFNDNAASVDWTCTANRGSGMLFDFPPQVGISSAISPTGANCTPEDGHPGPPPGVNDDLRCTAGFSTHTGTFETNPDASPGMSIRYLFFEDSTQHGPFNAILEP